MSEEHFDLLIVGAGLSGIGAAYHIQTRCPRKTYAILESRERIGGTWDLFRYPGIRSDSDMYTYGYNFKPWKEPRVIADGPSILDYICETAGENGIDRHIRFNHRVKGAKWDSIRSRWTIEAYNNGERCVFTAGFLFMCSGYYNYDQGYTPDFKGSDTFEGQIFHAQKWPEDLDYTGKKVVIIGSGATAVTLLPAMAEKTEHITMLQRSPTYILSLPDNDPLADILHKFLPVKLAYRIMRWKNIFFSIVIYQLSQRRPELVKKMLRKMLRRELGPDFDIDKHFKPTYNPWDQRLCVAPNGDLFNAIRNDSASVVTDQIDCFTKSAIKLKSGGELAADIIITATGLDLLALGGVEFTVDGEPLVPSERMGYKGIMLSDSPNLIFAAGYTNASWTLKIDLTFEYTCRLINHMDRLGYHYCMPHNSDPSIETRPIIDLQSGYVKRSVDDLPKQGSKAPWRVYQNYIFDMMNLRYGKIDDGVMRFYRRNAL